MDNHDDLSQFLVSRRAKLTLKQVGLPDFGGGAVYLACDGKKWRSWPA